MKRIAVLMVVALAACSSSAAPSTTASTPTTPSTTNPADPTTAAPTPTTVPVFAAADVSLTPFVSGLAAPVDLAWRTGDDTLFVVQQSGTVVPVRNGTVGAPVLDVSDHIAYGGEQGLLGLAFHPTKPLAYVNFTDTSGNTNVVEYAVGTDGVFDAASARTVITIEQPFPNHNGGDVVFGPDGMLYIGMGDGGAANDPLRHGQDPGSLLGKILRIDPTPSGDRPYAVPADNPYVDVDGAKPEVWSIGVRNPWRFSFDRANGDLWIADVGQDKWEEVDHVTAADGGGRGANFGWSAYEGTHRFNDDQTADTPIDPVLEYPHGDDGCSVSGGAMYRGDAIASLVGWYVFGDFCSGRLWAFANGKKIEIGNVPAVSAVVDGPSGELYALAYNEGRIVRLDPA